jgi:hypothetical protein
VRCRQPNASARCSEPSTMATRRDAPAGRWAAFPDKRIELLYSRGCPHTDAARRLLRSCLEAIGLASPIREPEGHYPSPTVLVDQRCDGPCSGRGRDVLSRSAHARPHLGCVESMNGLASTTNVEVS